MIEPQNQNRNNLDTAQGILYALYLSALAVGILLPICLVAGYVFYLAVKP